MEKDCIIRRAKPELDDARALLAVEHESLGDSPYSPCQVVSVLARPEHYAYLAFVKDEAAGFCSCIQTPLGREGQLEIDMLGVVAGHRRRGIGSSLIALGVRKAVGRGVRSFRAVAAADNVASQRAFQEIGFTRESAVDMMVYEVRGRTPLSFLPQGWTWRTFFAGSLRAPTLSQTFEATGPGREVHHLQDARGNLVAAAECLQVQTMAYAGLWVEEFEAPSRRTAEWMARALAERAKALDVDEVGYLIPHQGASETPISLVAAGYENVGEYLVLRGDAATLASRLGQQAIQG
ncbi:MAG: GNAT family N-acetyltransferase [Chloroflexota bacterium]